MRRAAWLRLGLLALLAAAGLALFFLTPVGDLLEREALAARLEALRDTPTAPLVLVALYLLLAPLGVPVSPLIFAGGMLFGTLLGGLWNLAGCLGGALVSYWVAHHLGRDAIVRLLGPERLARLEPYLQRHAFLAVFSIRFVPIPFAVANFAAALAGVRASTFAVATALGLAPTLLAMTWFAAAVTRAATEGGGLSNVELLVAACAVGVAIVVPAFWFHRMRTGRRDAGS